MDHSPLRRSFAFLALLTCVSSLGAQEVALAFRTLDVPGGGTCTYGIAVPPGFDPAVPHPVVIALSAATPTRASTTAAFAAALRTCVTRDGVVVVCPLAPDDTSFAAGGDAPLAALLRRLRIDLRVANGRFELAGIGDGAPSAEHIAARFGWEFQTPVTVGSDANAADALRTARDAHAIEDPTVRAIAAVLDDFHAAAAQADAARYFGHFTADGVFLGTDPDERWDVAAFQQWAARAFARDSAWIFVPRNRHIGVAPDGRSAWFDEVAGSAHYGDCRGTGTLLLVEGRWRIALYDLTVPVPNALLDDVVARIRGSTDAAPTPTLVYVVRHAEKATGDDPELTGAGAARAAALSRVLTDAPITAVFATEYRRTQATVRPTADAHGVTTTVVPARQLDALVQRIRAHSAAGAVLIAGHSNTVPALLAALGCAPIAPLAEDEFDRLFVVAVDGATARLVSTLRYGDAPR